MSPGRSAHAATHALALGGFLLLAGCNAPAQPFPDLPRIDVTTRFGVENLCDAGLSPQINLKSVPDGAASYVVQVSDINVLIDTPWRETIPVTSKTEIPEGAARNYVGPCLGDMTRFPPITGYGYQHRVEVLALDAAGKPIAYGYTVVFVESPYITAKRERLKLQQPNVNAVPLTSSVTPFGFPVGSYGTPGLSPATSFPGVTAPAGTGLLQ
ncbi:MAG: hypothetical protein JO128_04155 [Alphaproteobacteria bacterium]|nr:hypothetical protein [Alphaproteobacteria bacterium]